MSEDTLNPLGKWFKLVRSCDCGSDKPFTHWVKDKDGKPPFQGLPRM